MTSSLTHPTSRAHHAANLTPSGGYGRIKKPTGCALSSFRVDPCTVSSYVVGATSRCRMPGARNARLACAPAHATDDPSPRSPCASSCCAASARSLVRCVCSFCLSCRRPVRRRAAARSASARRPHVALLIGTILGTITLGTITLGSILGSIRDLGAPRQANAAHANAAHANAAHANAAHASAAAPRSAHLVGVRAMCAPRVSMRPCGRNGARSRARRELAPRCPRVRDAPGDALESSERVTVRRAALPGGVRAWL